MTTAVLAGAVAVRAEMSAQPSLFGGLGLPSAGALGAWTAGGHPAVGETGLTPRCNVSPRDWCERLERSAVNELPTPDTVGLVGWREPATPDRAASVDERRGQTPLPSGWQGCTLARDRTPRPARLWLVSGV